MSDNEQGFASEEAIEIVQFNYQPSVRAWTTLAKKKSVSYKKSNPMLLLQCTSRLINTSIHSEWIETLYKTKKPKNIVYNAGYKNNTNAQEQNLTFQSEFQSGNMEIISRKRAYQYQMYMKPDSNTTCHFQWFYFKVNIRRGNKNVKFTIKNFIKSTMLYSKGLKPFCKSLKNPDFHEFRQIQCETKFYQDSQTGYFCLDFSYNFEYDDDQVQFSSQPPYTFEHLNKFTSNLKCKKLTLGKTILGNKIPYLIFQAKKQVKVVAVAIARQHPGQAVGSWMMQGLINHLAEQKTSDYISWFIVPMVNVDGVILGNNRTGVIGHDFNRNWVIDDISNSKNHKLFPQIQSIVSLLKSLKRKYPRKVRMFLDLHGHSSQSNVFTYGPPHEEQSQYFYQSRLFPELISRRNSNFKLSQCSYIITPEKKNTARSIVFYSLGIPFTYTIQSTFGVMNDKNITTDNFIKIGEDIAHCANQFLTITVMKENLHGLNTLIQEIKIKYADSKNQGIEYDSASEASDENPDRKKIQEMIIANEETETEKINKRYQSHKTQGSEKSAKSLIKSAHIEEKDARSFSTRKKNQKKRINTQGQLILNRKECLFPNIGTRNSKLSFDQPNFLSNQEVLQTLKVDYIQQRLQKLRHSKIGKKILVINAYYS